MVPARLSQISSAHMAADPSTARCWSPVAVLGVGVCAQELGASNEHVTSLAAPDRLISLCVQDAIGAWHDQHQKHALTSASECLFLQLPRFWIDHGSIVKHRIPLELQPPTLAIPVFQSSETLTCDWVNYSILSAVLHVGDNTSCGHYRTLFISPEDFGENMLTDDNMQASLLQRNSQLTDVVKENCYVLVCGRCG